MDSIRSLMNKEGINKLNLNEIWKKLQRLEPIKFNQVTKDNFEETLQHYQKLSILFMDNEQNVILL